MNIYLLFPVFSKIRIMKCCEEIPIHLSNKGYNVKILTYLSDFNRHIQRIDGIELVKVREPNFLKAYRPSLSLHYLPLIPYLIKNRRDIDCIILYFASFSSFITCLIFKLVKVKRRNLCVIKMDSDGRPYIGV